MRRERKKKPIPGFASHEDAASFFDKTDTSDLEFESEGWESFLAQGSRPSRKGRKVVHVPVEIQARHLRRVVKMARAEGKTPREWISGVLEQALSK